MGLGIGGLIGFLTGGGYEAFFDSGWIDTAIGAGVGIIIGIGLGQITNVVIGFNTLKDKRHRQIHLCLLSLAFFTLQ
ncbi:hypothetical protein ACQKNC_12775 [Lysinibacillus sp. NPDC094177]|uniref:hypothetical protein n=1 Tax=Lysinibacillus sp. NPDC094177 TaxID=3390580 RepID=UPI003CFCC755